MVFDRTRSRHNGLFVYITVPHSAASLPGSTGSSTLNHELKTSLSHSRAPSEAVRTIVGHPHVVFQIGCILSPEVLAPETLVEYSGVYGIV